MPGKDLWSNCQNLRASIWQKTSGGLVGHQTGSSINNSGTGQTWPWPWAGQKTDAIPWPVQSSLEKTFSSTNGRKAHPNEEMAVLYTALGVHVSFIKLHSVTLQRRRPAAVFLPKHALEFQGILGSELTCHFTVLPSQASVYFILMPRHTFFTSALPMEAGHVLLFMHSFIQLLIQWIFIECSAGTKDTKVKMGTGKRKPNAVDWVLTLARYKPCPTLVI